MDSKSDYKSDSKSDYCDEEHKLVEIKCNDGKIPVVPYFLLKKFKLLTTILKDCNQNYVELDRPSDFISRNLYKISKHGVKMDDDELKYLGYEDNDLLNDELVYMFKTILYATRLYEGFSNLTSELDGNMITYCNRFYYNDNIEKVSINELKTNPYIYKRYKAVNNDEYSYVYNNYKNEIEANNIYSDMAKLLKKVCDNYPVKFYHYLKSIYRKFEFIVYHTYRITRDFRYDYKYNIDCVDEFYKKHGVDIDSKEKRNFYYHNYETFAALVYIRKRFPHLISTIYKRHLHKSLSEFFDVENFQFEVKSLEIKDDRVTDGIIIDNKSINIRLTCNMDSDKYLTL
jgi:hypothetical protein